jgi:hypothetical protein
MVTSMDEENRRPPMSRVYTDRGWWDAPQDSFAVQILD